jgi:futalosine hydrolase
MNSHQNVDIPAQRRVLIVTAVAAEKEAVLRGLSNAEGFEVLAGGVGPAAAAASTASALTLALATSPYSMVLSLGIGGGFKGQAEIGSLVVASQIIAADLGTETPEGFRTVDELGFGSATVSVNLSLAARIVEAFHAANLQVTQGPVLTVSTVTGSAATAEELAKRIPGAAAEAMEGFGVATAASQLGLPCLEIRSISNCVGPRDRSAWRIGDALQALEAASKLLPEVLQ